MDVYRNFASLQRHERNYSMVLCDRRAAVTVLAPHGGAIEPHTAEIARMIAGIDSNYFLFIGQKPRRNRDLHITSHRWDEPRSVSLTARSVVVITVHGTSVTDPVVVLGGRDTTLRSLIEAQLTERNLFCRAAGKRNSGLHPDNVCNRGLTGSGVQLEIARPLRDNPACWPLLAAAVRAAVSRRIRLLPMRETSCPDSSTPSDRTAA